MLRFGSCFVRSLQCFPKTYVYSSFVLVFASHHHFGENYINKGKVFFLQLTPIHCFCLLLKGIRSSFPRNFSRWQLKQEKFTENVPRINLRPKARLEANFFKAGIRRSLSRIQVPALEFIEIHFCPVVWMRCLSKCNLKFAAKMLESRETKSLKNITFTLGSALEQAWFRFP